MSDTLGVIKYSIVKYPIAAGIDSDLLDAIINQRYFEYLRSFPWARLRASSTITTVAEYTTGTIAVSEGGTTLTGTDTVWTSAMTGRRIRIANRNEDYTFTYVSATSATIAGAYEGDDETEATYVISKRHFTLPSDCGNLESITVPETNDELDQINVEELDQIDPARGTYGDPTTYTLYVDDSSTPPVSQVELWPTPQTARALPIRYIKQVSRLSAASDILLPWVSSEAIIAGVLAELGQPNGEQRWMKLLQDAQREETRRIPPMQIQMAERFVEHRVQRLTGNLDVWEKRRRMP